MNELTIELEIAIVLTLNNIEVYYAEKGAFSL